MLVTEGPPNSPWRLHFENANNASAGLGSMIENQHLKGALIKAVKASASIEILAPISIAQINHPLDIEHPRRGRSHARLRLI